MGVISGEEKSLPTESLASTVYKTCQENKNIFMIDGKNDEEFSYKEFFLTSRKIAATLKIMGIGEGDIVSYFGETSKCTYCIMYGIIFAGATMSPHNADLKSDVVSQMFETTEPKMIFYEDENHLKLINESLEKLSLKPKIFNIKNFNQSLVSDEIAEKFQPENIGNCGKHVGFILFTSGTTGVPKAVKLSDLAVQYSSLNLNWPQGRVLLTSPVFWISNIYIICKCILENNTVIIPKLKEPASVLTAIQKHKVELWFSAPSLLLDMCCYENLKNYDISTLKYLYSGGSQLLLEQRYTILKRILKGRNIFKMIYGSSEVGVISQWPEKDLDPNSEEFGSSGEIFPGTSLVIKDVNTGKILGPGEQGEICVKSVSMMNGYMNKNLKESDSDADGWWHMGDIGYYDQNGFLYYVSRLKDVFKYRGTQIAPSELEKILVKIPSIAEACVVGKPHLIDGEWPAAFVVLKPNMKISEKEINDLVTAQVPDTHRLRAGVHILKSLPKNAVGKVISANLLKMLE